MQRAYFETARLPLFPFAGPIPPPPNNRHSTHRNPGPQELDEARREAALLQRERDQLAADAAALEGRCNNRSRHVSVLLDSNHRYCRVGARGGRDLTRTIQPTIPPGANTTDSCAGSACTKAVCRLMMFVVPAAATACRATSTWGGTAGSWR
jgi:hypothetical protein